MAAIFAISLNEPALIGLLYGEAGPVGIDIQRRAEKVAVKARQNASGGMVARRTGALADSVTVSSRRIGPETGRVVGSNLPYARYLEEGAPQGQIIYAQNHRFLAGGRYADPQHSDPLIREDLTIVAWPGFPSYPWLSSALEEAAD